MTPKTPTDHLALLIRFQKWRKGDDEIEQPDPRDISEAIDYAIQCCEAVQMLEEWIDCGDVDPDKVVRRVRALIQGPVEWVEADYDKE